MAKRNQCECERGGSFPINGNGFSRRQFLKVGGTGLVASYFLPVLNAKLLGNITRGIFAGQLVADGNREPCFVGEFGDARSNIDFLRFFSV